MRAEYNQTASNVLDILDDKPSNSKPLELTPDNLRKLDAAN